MYVKKLPRITFMSRLSVNFPSANLTSATPSVSHGSIISSPQTKDRFSLWILTLQVDILHSYSTELLYDNSKGSF